MQTQRFRSRFLALLLTSMTFFISGCGGSGGGGTNPPDTAKEWAWISGADQDGPVPFGAPGPGSAPYNSDPYYGTLGVAGTANVPGGRNSSAYWTGKDGNFWLFGGDGLDGSPAPIEGLLNDLWEFSPATNEWTWIGGSSTLSNLSCVLGPGFCGFPGVYGTQGSAEVSNIPGGRKLSVTWTDSAGNLWLFGGYGIDSTGALSFLNDLWEFNPAKKMWTWISGSSVAGSNAPGQLGNYGTQGVPAPSNVPPGLYAATGWIDSGNNLWLFGGIGISAQGSLGYEFNNLWEFNPTTNEWTWMSGGGANPDANYGVYGTLGTPAPGNIPSGRKNSTGWTDSSGNMWLFGGYGIYPTAGDLAGSENDLNEVWEFNPTSKQWAWMAGTAGGIPNSYGNPGPPPGSYGTLGTPSANNHPGGREGATGWIDGSGNLWLFGGEGDDSVGSYGALNDLWEFSQDNQQWIWMGGYTTAWQGAVYGVEGTPSAANIPGARYNSASWKDSNGDLWLFAGWGIIESANGGSTILNDLWRYQP
jgi:N-acetylneuraminic acid mutarotase